MQILLIEHKIKNSALLRSALEKQKYKVDAVFNHEYGLQMAIKGSYDLFIVDLAVNKIVGISIVQELISRKPNVPVLALMWHINGNTLS